MSYILQALKRAEEDRRAALVAVASGPARLPAAPAGRPHDPARPHRLSPRTPAGPPAAPTGRTLWWWLAGGGLGLVINALVFGAVFVVTRPSGLAVVAPPPVAVEKTEATTVAAAPAEQAPTVQLPAMQVPTVQAPAAEAEPSGTKPPDVVARARAQTGTGSSRAREGDPKDAGLRPPGIPAATAPQPDTALAIAPPTAPTRPTPPAPAQPIAPASTIAPEQPPSAAPPPGRRRRRGALREPSLPTASPAQPGAVEPKVEIEESKLKIEVLVWAADPEKRMVYLNGRKYVEGEALESGAVIEQIDEDGVVLVHQGQRIRVPSEAR
jgi:Type II secretion system protein B